jgi:hypothetical protein
MQSQASNPRLTPKLRFPETLRCAVHPVPARANYGIFLKRKPGGGTCSNRVMRRLALGWRDRSFCTTRDALLRCVREYCGDVDEKALTDLQALPEYHVDAEQPE